MRGKPRLKSEHNVSSTVFIYRMKNKLRNLNGKKLKWLNTCARGGQPSNQQKPAVQSANIVCVCTCLSVCLFFLSHFFSLPL